VFYYPYDVTYSCYFGAMEAIDNAVEVTGSVTSPLMVYTNIIYNFGLVYDSVKNMVLYFLGAPRPNHDTPYDVGYNLGSSFYYILFDS